MGQVQAQAIGRGLVQLGDVAGYVQPLWRDIEAGTPAGHAIAAGRLERIGRGFELALPVVEPGGRGSTKMQAGIEDAAAMAAVLRTGKTPEEFGRRLDAIMLASGSATSELGQRLSGIGAGGPVTSAGAGVATLARVNDVAVRVWHDMQGADTITGNNHAADRLDEISRDLGVARDAALEFGMPGGQGSDVGRLDASRKAVKTLAADLHAGVRPKGWDATLDELSSAAGRGVSAIGTRLSRD